MNDDNSHNQNLINVSSVSNCLSYRVIQGEMAIEGKWPSAAIFLVLYVRLTLSVSKQRMVQQHV